METDEEKVDKAVLALVYLTTFKDKPNWSAWKSHDWDSLARLHQKGLHLESCHPGKISLADRGRCETVTGFV
jgi:hypothetical protein